MYRCLKQCLSAPLAFWYNQFLSVGYVALEWRAAYIVPVHKKGITGDVNNYRPISLSLPVLLPKFLNELLLSVYLIT